MTFGKKLKQARVNACLTQQDLAEKLLVSRAAIAKWESDRGIPDVTNLKMIAAILNVSVDYLLDDGNTLDVTVYKKQIDLTKYDNSKKLSRIKKVKIKELIIREEFPDAEILRLTVTKIKNTKSKSIADAAIGLFALALGNIPLFGTQEFGETLNSLDQQFYLVNQNNKQLFVLLTDEYIISKTTGYTITSKKFDIADRSFQIVGKVD